MLKWLGNSAPSGSASKGRGGDATNKNTLRQLPPRPLRILCVILNRIFPAQSSRGLLRIWKDKRGGFAGDAEAGFLFRGGITAWLVLPRAAAGSDSDKLPFPGHQHPIVVLHIPVEIIEPFPAAEPVKVFNREKRVTKTCRV